MSALVDLEKWYALSVRSRFEKKTDYELRKKGIESFLPVIEEIHFWSDRKKKVCEPLFRGYVFVRSDLSNRLTILQTDGVVRFVGIRNQPSPVPEKEMNWIRILSNHPDAIQREEFVALGDTVRIIAGPFRGIEGFVLQMKDSARVVISFASISQSVAIEVPLHFVEHIESPSKVLESSW